MKRLIIILFFIVAFSACNQDANPKRSIVGKWQLVAQNGTLYDGNLFIEFYSTQNIILTDEDVSYRGTWSWDDAQSINLTIVWENSLVKDSKIQFTIISPTGLTWIQDGNTIRWIKI